MSALWIDLETYSTVPINHGTYKYAENAEVMLVAWALGDGPVQVHDCTAQHDLPFALMGAICDPGVTVIAHNSMFDRNVLRYARGITVPIPRWRDTMVQAFAHSLPGSLAALCDVLGVPHDKAKDKDGRRLVLKFCKPFHGKRRTRETDPEDWAKFVDYARLDIEAMREVEKRLPKWNWREYELALWHLDQRINDRGMAVDRELAEAAILAVHDVKRENAWRAQEITEGDVMNTTRRDSLLRHILEVYGVSLPDLTGPTVERRLKDVDLPAEVRELLQIRTESSTTSTAKFQALLNATSRDGRLRGALQFNGASRTGRWAGRSFQPQNMTRPTMPADAIEVGIEALKAGVADLYGPVMQIASNAIRGCIVAPPGRKIVAADLSNIEGRTLAWLAGEEWKLSAFRAFDAGRGADLYRLTYARSFGVDVDTVSKDQRQVGKVQELALGYQGGVGAFLTFSEVYGIDLEALAANKRDFPPRLVREAHDFFAWTQREKRPTYGLSEDAFVVCEMLKRAWREAHPMTVAFWSDLENAARCAITSPGVLMHVGELRVQRDGAWLRIRLPSGRCLCYPAPAIEPDGRISYMGMHQYTKQWQRLYTYGGKLAENVTQAVARDVLCHGMKLADDHGFPVILTVHDEIVCEVLDEGAPCVDSLVHWMTRVPEWAHGLPLAASGFEAQRYGKE